MHDDRGEIAVFLLEHPAMQKYLIAISCWTMNLCVMLSIAPVAMIQAWLRRAAQCSP
jgi:hypothetical protein